MQWATSLTLYIFLLLAVQPVQGQLLFDAGPNISTLSTRLPNSSVRPLVGWYASMGIQYRYKGESRLSASLQMQFFNYGYTTKTSGSANRYRISALQFPIGLSYAVSEEIYLEGGFYFGLIYSTKVKTATLPAKSLWQENGGKSGVYAGLEYKVSTNFSINMRYYYDFKAIAKATIINSDGTMLPGTYPIKLHELGIGLRYYVDL